MIFVFTHDSIGLGEDGPTHQAVEHAASAAPDPEHGRLAAVRHRRNRGRMGRGDRTKRWADAACSSRARTCPFAATHARRRSLTSARGGYVLSEARGGERAGGDHRDRLGSGACDGGAESARGRGYSRARGLDAVHVSVRPPGRCLPRIGAAAGRAARRGRSRRERFLAQVRRARGRRDRHRSLRRIRAGRASYSNISDSPPKTS